MMHWVFRGSLDRGKGSEHVSTSFITSFCSGLKPSFVVAASEAFSMFIAASDQSDARGDVRV